MQFHSLDKEECARDPSLRLKSGSGQDDASNKRYEQLTRIPGFLGSRNRFASANINSSPTSATKVPSCLRLCKPRHLPR